MNGKGQTLLLKMRFDHPLPCSSDTQQCGVLHINDQYHILAVHRKPHTEIIIMRHFNRMAHLVVLHIVL